VIGGREAQAERDQKQRGDAQQGFHLATPN
jgi:hypothetical protein